MRKIKSFEFEYSPDSETALDMRQEELVISANNNEALPVSKSRNNEVENLFPSSRAEDLFPSQKYISSTPINA